VGCGRLREEKRGTPGGWAVPLIPPPERTNSAGVPVTKSFILRISKTCQQLFLTNCWRKSIWLGVDKVVLGRAGNWKLENGKGKLERRVERPADWIDQISSGL
jgi:hypothetical protein